MGSDMIALAIAAGSALVITALVDVAWTTVAAGSGGGPVTTRIARRLWRVALALHRRTKGDKLLEASGVVIVFALLSVWIALAVTGWTAVFSASDGAVRDAETGAPADLVARIYFTGYTVFTLGNGDFSPGDGAWQIATVLATGTGLVLVTLSITYLVPVASAVAQRRQLAGTIASLGDSPQEMLIRAWTGSGFGALPQHLVSLGPLVERVRQQHFAYPVLHYFHSSERPNAAAIQIVNLDDALLLLEEAVVPGVRPEPGVVVPLRQSLWAFLDTTAGAFVGHVDRPHPPPALDPLREAGIPVDEDAYRNAVARQEHRRRLLRGLLEDDGWARD